MGHSIAKQARTVDGKMPDPSADTSSTHVMRDVIRKTRHPLTRHHQPGCRHTEVDALKELLLFSSALNGRYLIAWDPTWFDDAADTEAEHEEEESAVVWLLTGGAAAEQKDEDDDAVVVVDVVVIVVDEEVMTA